MLKFVKEHLQTIDNIQIYPLISLVLFVVFFLVLFGWVFSMNKKHLNNLKQLPLSSPHTPEEL